MSMKFESPAHEAMYRAMSDSLGSAEFTSSVWSAAQVGLQAALSRSGEAVALTYTNWRGETATRTLRPMFVWFGSTEWHPEPQWLLKALDVEKNAERDFALKDFGAPPPSVPTGYKLVPEEPTVSVRSLEQLAGYVFSGDYTTVRLFQDDATNEWIVKVGERLYWGASLGAALEAAFIDASIASAPPAPASQERGEVKRCTICGFVVDTRYKAEKPSASFEMRGRTKATPSPSRREALEEARGIYIASKVKHAPRWRLLRDKIGYPIISTWIDEAGEGESTDLADLWDRCINEASRAEVLVFNAEPGELFKGAWVELGAALSHGVLVLAVGLDKIDGLTIAHDKRIRHFPGMVSVMAFLKPMVGGARFRALATDAKDPTHD